MKKTINSSRRSQDTTLEQAVYQRYNPKFIGIGHVLQKEKLRRKIIQRNQKDLANKVEFLVKQNQRALKNEKQKEQKFIKMIEIANRKRRDEQQKQYNRQKKQRELNRQRNINLSHRIQNQMNKRKVFTSLYQYNASQAKRIKEQSNIQLSRLRESQIHNYSQNRQKVLSISTSHEKSKQKINQFFKHKNDMYTTSYLQRIGQERKLSDNKTLSIRYLQTQEMSLRQRLTQSKSRINEMNTTIDQFYRQSRIKLNQKLGKSKKYENFIVRSRTSSIQNPQLKQVYTKSDTFEQTNQIEDYPSFKVQNKKNLQNLYDF